MPSAIASLISATLPRMARLLVIDKQFYIMAGFHIKRIFSLHKHSGKADFLHSVLMNQINFHLLLGRDLESHPSEPVFQPF